MVAAIVAAVVAAFLSLGGASLVLADASGHGNAGDNANGNAYGHGNGNAHSNGNGSAQQGPAPAPAPAPAASNGSPRGHGNGHAQRSHSGARSHNATTQSAPAPQATQPAARGNGHSQKQWTAPAPASTQDGGSHSTATSGPGNSSQGCDGSHNSNTGHGANHSGPYDNTCDGSPSGNGNGNGKATGKPCAGCVGNADDKNPKGQYPNGSDHNAGYECDRNHGIGRSNPAHTGCTGTQAQTPPPSTCSGDMSGANGESSDCSQTPPPCANQSLGSALTDSAALALKLLSVAHPELGKLSEIAAKRAADVCGNNNNDNGNNGDNGNGHTPVTICHATGSATNPYVEITIDENGLHGHDGHADDIIPAPAGGCPQGSTQGTGGQGCSGDMSGGSDNGSNGNGSNETCGNNNNDNGNNGDNGNGHTPVTICHATGSATNPYVEITIDENGLHGHDGHADDIIPAPAGGCPQGSTTPTPTTETTPETPTVPPLAPVAPANTVLGATENGQTPPPAGSQEVLGERRSGTSAPAASTPPASGNEVLGANAQGTSAPAAGTAPAAANAAQPAAKAGGSLPFTGTDALWVLFVGCLMLLGGIALHRVAGRRTN